MHPQATEEHYQQVPELCRQQKHAEALSMLEQLSPDLPNCPMLLHHRAESLAGMGRADDAETACDQALARLTQCKEIGRAHV